MNPIAILSIAVLAIFFLIITAMLMRIFIELIIERDLSGVFLSGLALVGVCLAAILCFNMIRPRTKQIVCTDYQVEERVDSFGNTTFVITYER